MAEKKKRRRPRSYLDDFKKDASGNYVYRGDVYKYSGGEKSFRRLGWELIAVSAVIAAAVIGAGFSDTPAMLNCFYVIIPYIAEVAFAALSVWAVIRIVYGGEELRSYVYKHSVRAIPWRTTALIIAAGAGAAAITVFGITEPENAQWARMAWIYGAKAAVIAGAALLKAIAANVSWNAK